MNALQLAQTLKDKKLNVVDIRSKEKYQLFHLPGAVNISPQALYFNAEQFLDKDKKYYLICNTNNTASSIVKVLKNEGFDVEDVPGGMESLPKKNQ